MLGEVERFPGSKECMVWYFCFKPLSPFSLMKYYSMLGSLWEPTNDEPKKRGPTLSDEERKFRKI